MLREEQIDIRRKRAAKEPLTIRNLGRNRVFSDYRVTNSSTGRDYRVSIRGFDLGDNSCDCPDFRTNTLGTCKHIEAVLAALKEELPPQVYHRKATVTHPEIVLNYGEQLQLAIHLPPRYSDPLGHLASTFFDPKGIWNGGERYDHLINQVAEVPEQVTIYSDAMRFMERELERREMARRERQWLAELEEAERLGQPLPLQDLLAVRLYPYQIRGAVFLACRGRCILGDDMGLGKTVQTLAAVEILARERGIERVLVVAPASVKYQWQTEIQKYTGRPVQVIDGTAEQRRALYRESTFYRLTNYEMAVRDLNELNAWEPDLIVLDEAQRIKNWESKTTRAIKRLASRYAIVLTGTPLENRLEELYSIVQFVDDRRLGPAFQFLHDHRLLGEEGKLIGYRNLDLLREKLEPVLLRRTRGDVLSQLPPRTDTNIFVEMAPQQRTLYGEHCQTLARLITKKVLTEIDHRRILACLNNLRMVCNSTFLLDQATNVSPKLQEFAELLQELLGSGSHKIVVFTQWELMQRKVAEVLEQLQVEYCLLQGNIPARARKPLLDRFRDDPRCRVFLSTDAGGSGLNLQTADTVINLEIPWNPAVLEQRIARVHRLGQQRPVQVFHFLTRDSIEDRVLKVVGNKRQMFEAVFDSSTAMIHLDPEGSGHFLESVRELVLEKIPDREPDLPANLPGNGLSDSSARWMEMGIELLEELAEWSQKARVVSLEGKSYFQIPLPEENWHHRATLALEKLLQQLRLGQE